MKTGSEWMVLMLRKCGVLDVGSINVQDTAFFLSMSMFLSSTGVADL